MPRRRPSAALPAAPLLLAALAALLLPSAHAGGGLGKRGTEFTPSVVMTKQDEYGQHCRTAVDRAFALGAVNVKFVPTVFYYPAKVQATGGDGVGSYAFRDASWQYQPASPGTIAQFQEDLTNCLQYAVSKGMGVGVLVHLDNASGYTWRNALEFDPLAKYGGYSYDDGALILDRDIEERGGGPCRPRRCRRFLAPRPPLILAKKTLASPSEPSTTTTTTQTVVLKPVATALNKVLRPGVDVVLTVNGETGRSVAQYAASWLKLVQESKKRILANRPRVDPREVSVGISLNYNRLAGWVDFDSAVKPSRECFGFFVVVVFFRMRPPRLCVVFLCPSTYQPTNPCALPSTTTKQKTKPKNITKTVSYYFLDLHQKSLPPATRAKFQKVWNDGLKKYPIDADNLRKLYEAVDVIGVSGE